MERQRREALETRFRGDVRALHQVSQRDRDRGKSTEHSFNSDSQKLNYARNGHQLSKIWGEEGDRNSGGGVTGLKGPL